MHTQEKNRNHFASIALFYRLGRRTISKRGVRKKVSRLKFRPYFRMMKFSARGEGIGKRGMSKREYIGVNF